jgi:ABC-type sulfate/molybdate transport systems ATPase subunit
MDNHSAAIPRLSVSDVSVAFGATQVLERVSMHVYPAEVLVVLGDSGCGKTTLLKVLAGLLEADAGLVEIDARELGRIPIRERRVVYLDQEALLFEHLDVFENVAFSLRMRRVAQDIVNKQVEELLRAIGLSEHARKRSWQLSGGQRQRIAFARAVLAEPRVFLLDEPFGSLDARTRGEMQRLFQQLAARYSLTTIFVTHDIREALVLGDRFATLRSGHLRCYRDRAAFVSDRQTGVQDEINFWKQF